MDEIFVRSLFRFGENVIITLECHLRSSRELGVESICGCSIRQLFVLSEKMINISATASHPTVRPRCRALQTVEADQRQLQVIFITLKIYKSFN